MSFFSFAWDICGPHEFTFDGMQAGLSLSISNYQYALFQMKQIIL